MHCKNFRNSYNIKSLYQKQIKKVFHLFQEDKAQEIKTRLQKIAKYPELRSFSLKKKQKDYTFSRRI